MLFAEIADAYFEREMYAEAKPIYELLGGDSAVCAISCFAFEITELVYKTSSIYILLQTAACMRNIDELRDAADVYEHSQTIFSFLHIIY